MITKTKRGYLFLSMLTSDPGLPGGPTGPGSPSAPCKPKNVAIFTLLAIYDIIIYLVEKTGYKSGQTSNIKPRCGSLCWELPFSGFFPVHKL